MVVANSCPYGFGRQVSVYIANLNRVGKEYVVVLSKHSFKCVSIILIIAMVIADEDLVAGLGGLHVTGHHGSIRPLCGCNLLSWRCTGDIGSIPYAGGLGPQYSLFTYRMAGPVPTQEACRAAKLGAVLSCSRSSEAQHRPFDAPGASV